MSMNSRNAFLSTQELVSFSSK